MAESQTPYSSQPPAAFWRKAVSQLRPDEVDPVFNWSLRITPDSKVATAGSCFAQHIARRLAVSGFKYFVTEQGHPQLGEEISRMFGYGVFSARYGNIYTSRQLLQLVKRAYGQFSPGVDVWEAEGALIDPFRPNIQPGGFPTRMEYDFARIQHFAAVRQMLEHLDVFVFTLGLTEVWIDGEDGAAYPLCPGVAGGEFIEGRHRLLNLGVDDVVSDMTTFIDLLQAVNPRAQVILTVSPVPLIATAENSHVISATTYSKSVLRVAAETLQKGLENVHYFPSYEIITGAFSRGEYYAEDLRDVTEAGVDHVMRLFFRHATDKAVKPLPRRAASTPGPKRKKLSQVFSVICDENSITSASSN